MVSTHTAESDPLLAPVLSDEQITLLRRYGEVRPTVVGQELFRGGDRGYDFIVILSGTVTLYDDQPEGRRELVTGGAGQFIAELGVLTGERLFTTAVVREPGAILVVPVARLRTVIAQDQTISDLILQTGFRRRTWLTRAHVGVHIAGSRQSPDTRRLIDFATRNHLLHVWVDADDPAATPQVIPSTGEVLDNPSNAELSRAAGFGTVPTPGHLYDLVVVGSGPAGLAASVYASADGLDTAMLDGLGVGGQIATTTRIENYLGFPVGISGDEFAERALLQAQRFDATLLIPSTATGLARRDGHYRVLLDSGEEISARCVIISTGVTYRKLDADGLARFDGRLAGAGPGPVPAGNQSPRHVRRRGRTQWLGQAGRRRRRRRVDRRPAGTRASQKRSSPSGVMEAIRAPVRNTCSRCATPAAGSTRSSSTGRWRGPRRVGFGRYGGGSVTSRGFISRWASAGSATCVSIRASGAPKQ